MSLLTQLDKIPSSFCLFSSCPLSSLFACSSFPDYSGIIWVYFLEFNINVSIDSDGSRDYYK